MRARKDEEVPSRYRRVMQAAELTLDMTVDEALARWPELGEVFMRRQMACAGCAMAPFERLSDVARSYRRSPARLLRELRRKLHEAGR